MDSACFPVGGWISGLIESSPIVSLLTFLDIPSKHTKTAVKLSVLALVKALYSTQVRFGGMHGRKQNHSSDDEVMDDEELQTDPCGRQQHHLAQAASRKTAELL